MNIPGYMDAVSGSLYNIGNSLRLRRALEKKNINLAFAGGSVTKGWDGSKYLEKWTGRGGAVGSGSVSQKLTELEPGQYELTAAAQNIQEDSPTASQTGAWIYAGEQKTTVTIRDTYKVSFSYVPP